MKGKAMLESMQFRKAFGDFIKTERKKQDLFQRDICFELGITQAYYSTIESGKREIGIVLAKKICDTLNVGFDDFMKQFQESSKQTLDEAAKQEQDIVRKNTDATVMTDSDLLKGLVVKKNDGKAYSIYLSAEANAKLERLAKQYGCGKGKVIEELLKSIP